MTTILRKIILGLIVASFFGVDGQAAESPLLRPTTRGIALAYPKQRYVSVPRNLLVGWNYDIRVPLMLQIDSNGTVTQVQKFIDEDSLFFVALDTAFRAVSFVPGLVNGVPTPQKVLVDCLISPQASSAFFTSPVSDSMVVSDASSYAQALTANGLEMPVISRLAPYFCTLTARDSLAYLPTILLKVLISKSGSPRTIEVLRSDYPSVTDQIVSVVNWGDFDIASGTKSGTTDFFLVMAFHPAARYPTRQIGTTEKDTVSLVERFLTRVYPDTLGVMLPPLPRRIHADSISLAEATNRRYGRISVWLKVDSSGQAQIERSSRLERPVYRLLLQVLKQVPLYPALGFDGRPQNFSGLVYVDFDGSAAVRIRLDWLYGRTADPIR